MDQAVKKQVLRMFTYGLYAITCVAGDDVNAFTANWLTQVSFEPPLVAVSVENTSKSLPMIERSRAFAINILRSDQRGLAGTLGKSALKHPTKMTGIAYDIQNGYLVLREALAWLGCTVQHVVPAGDSTLFVAEVVEAGLLAEGPPLTMHETGFRHAG